MDWGAIHNWGPPVALLVGIYVIVNRSEDRLGRRIDTLESHINQRFNDHGKLFTP